MVGTDEADVGVGVRTGHFVEGQDAGDDGGGQLLASHDAAGGDQEGKHPAEELIRVGGVLIIDDDR